MVVPFGSWYQTPTKIMVVRKPTYKKWWLDFQASSKHWKRIAHEIDATPQGKSYLSTLIFWVRSVTFRECFLFCRGSRSDPQGPLEDTPDSLSTVSVSDFFLKSGVFFKWYVGKIVDILRSGLNSHYFIYFYVTGDGHQLNSRGFISTQWAEFSMHGGWRLRSWPSEGKL